MTEKLSERETNLIGAGIWLGVGMAFLAMGIGYIAFPPDQNTWVFGLATGAVFLYLGALLKRKAENTTTGEHHEAV